MFDFFFEILYNLFGWGTGDATNKKLGAWSKILLLLIILMGIILLYYMLKLVSSR